MTFSAAVMLASGIQVPLQMWTGSGPIVTLASCSGMSCMADLRHMGLEPENGHRMTPDQYRDVATSRGRPSHFDSASSRM